MIKFVLEKYGYKFINKYCNNEFSKFIELSYDVLLGFFVIGGSF